MTSDDKWAEQMEQASAGAEPIGKRKGVEPGADPDGTETVVPGQLPGELLLAARERLTLSIDEVSMRLRLLPRQITALEANDFDALPGMASVRGFIRSYAKLLGLDPEPLVAMLAHEPNPAFEPIVVRRPLSAPSMHSRRFAPPVTHRRGARRLTGLAAVVLVFVGTLAFIAYRYDMLPLPAQLNLTMPDIVAGAAQEARVPAVQPAAPELAEGHHVNAKAVPSGVLELRANQDSWVEVITIKGERKLFSKLMKAGSVEPVDVTEPVVLIVGNVAGIEASLRGQPLDLKATARENVVRVNLE